MYIDLIVNSRLDYPKGKLLKLFLQPGNENEVSTCYVLIGTKKMNRSSLEVDYLLLTISPHPCAKFKKEHVQVYPRVIIIIIFLSLSLCSSATSTGS